MKTLTIRTAYGLVAVLALAMSGCSDQGEEGTAQLSQALDTSAQQVRHRRMHRPILRLTHDVDVNQPGQTVEALLDELASLVASRIPCAQLEIGSGSLSIDFGELTADCQYEGARYAGTLVIEVSEGSEGMQLKHIYDLFGNDEFSLRGQLDVSATADGRHIYGNLSMERGGMARDLELSRDESDQLVDGVLYGVQIDGWVLMAGERGSMKRTMDALIVREGDAIPESGQIHMQRVDNNRWRMLTFERADEQNITVTMQSPRGEHSATVPADGSGNHFGAPEARRPRRSGQFPQ